MTRAMGAKGLNRRRLVQRQRMRQENPATMGYAEMARAKVTKGIEKGMG